MTSRCTPWLNEPPMVWAAPDPTFPELWTEWSRAPLYVRLDGGELASGAHRAPVGRPKVVTERLRAAEDSASAIAVIPVQAMRTGTLWSQLQALVNEDVGASLPYVLQLGGTHTLIPLGVPKAWPGKPPHSPRDFRLLPKGPDSVPTLFPRGSPDDQSPIFQDIMDEDPPEALRRTLATWGYYLFEDQTGKIRCYLDPEIDVKVTAVVLYSLQTYLLNLNQSIEISVICEGTELAFVLACQQSVE